MVGSRIADATRQGLRRGLLGARAGAEEVSEAIRAQARTRAELIEIIFFLAAWAVLMLAASGCAGEPSRIEDGPQMAAPFGYWDYCERHHEDPICSFVKR